MSNKLFIIGRDVTDDVTEGLEDIAIDAGLNESTNTYGLMLTTDIVVTGDTYNLLYNTFFKSCAGYQNKLPGVFKTPVCGGLSIDMVLTSDGMGHTPEKKEIDMQLKSTDQVSEAYARLDSETITSNGFIDNVEIPIMYYCDQPNYMNWVVLYITMTLRTVLNVIDTAINAITFGIADLNLSGAVFGSLDNWITGVGRWGPAPLVREMIDYQCKAVGLKFVSSILNNSASSRYNLAMFCLTGGTNGDYKDTSKIERQRVLSENSPIYTTIGLLTELSEAFAAEYRIIGDTLYFERFDYFFELANQKLFSTKDYCLAEPVRFNYSIDNGVAYGDYIYTQDAMDAEGNKVLDKSYKDKVDYNYPYNPSQKGKKQRLIKFSTPRFMFDEYLYRKRGFFNFEKLIDEFRSGPDSFLEAAFISTDNIKRSNDLVLSSGVLSYEKLIVLEPNFNRSDAKAYREKIGNKDSKNYYRYNSPMHLDGDASYPELVKDFLFMDNPRVRPDKYDVSDIEITCDCDVVRDVISDFQRLYIADPTVAKIIPGSVKMQFSEGKVKVTFSGNVALCE